MVKDSWVFWGLSAQRGHSHRKQKLKIHSHTLKLKKKREKRSARSACRAMDFSLYRLLFVGRDILDIFVSYAVISIPVLVSVELPAEASNNAEPIEGVYILAEGAR